MKGLFKHGWQTAKTKIVFSVLYWCFYIQCGNEKGKIMTIILLISSFVLQGKLGWNICVFTQQILFSICENQIWFLTTFDTKISRPGIILKLQISSQSIITVLEWTVGPLIWSMCVHARRITHVLSILSASQLHFLSKPVNCKNIGEHVALLSALLSIRYTCGIILNNIIFEFLYVSLFLCFTILYVSISNFQCVLFTFGWVPCIICTPLLIHVRLCL